jgi:hypothetical protein
VNGVLFNETGAAGTNYALTGAGTAFSDFANNVTGSSGQMLRDFFYTGDSSGNATLTLSGLIPGRSMSRAGTMLDSAVRVVAWWL